MRFNFTLEFKVNRSVVIKLRDKPEKLSKLVSIINVTLEFFDLLKHRDKQSHVIRKDGYSQ